MILLSQRPIAAYIRDFFPKGTDFFTISSAEVARVERLLNAKPRKSSASVHRKRFSTPSLTLISMRWEVESA
jgi:hypothetical protein